MKKLLKTLIKFKSLGENKEVEEVIKPRILVKEPVYPPNYTDKSKLDFNSWQKHLQKQSDKINKTNVAARMS